MSLPMAGGWNGMGFRVPSDLNQSGILGFCTGWWLISRGGNKVKIKDADSCIQDRTGKKNQLFEHWGLWSLPKLFKLSGCTLVSRWMVPMKWEPLMVYFGLMLCGAGICVCCSKVLKRELEKGDMSCKRRNRAGCCLNGHWVIIVLNALFL